MPITIYFLYKIKITSASNKGSDWFYLFLFFLIYSEIAVSYLYESIFLFFISFSNGNWDNNSHKWL